MMTVARPPLDLTTIQIGPLQNKLSLEGFVCGESTIDKWAKKNAFKHHSQNRLKVYCATCGSSITAIGLYSLSMRYEEVSKLLTEERGHYVNDKHFPAIYIGSLAVRVHYQNQKLGTLLLIDALRRAHSVAQTVPFFGVALRSVSDRTTILYEKFGFGIRENCSYPLMVLPIWSLNDLMGSPS